MKLITLYRPVGQKELNLIKESGNKKFPPRLEEFNSKIIGEITVVKYFYGEKLKIIMEQQLKHISKLMSLVLRHKPETIGLQLDENGWANVAELIEKLNESGTAVDTAIINMVVDTNDKKRFAFNDDKTKIRASQGHSIDVELGLKAVQPPDVLYHGTTDRFLESILATGLTKQQRQHVHLSEQLATARAVGSRHGKPVILTINAKAMSAAGFLFYLSDNGVWLVESVPVEYITV